MTDGEDLLKVLHLSLFSRVDHERRVVCFVVLTELRATVTAQLGCT